MARPILESRAVYIPGGCKKREEKYSVFVEYALLIVALGLLFDYTNGFHDAANVVSTVIATKALRPLAAISMAALLNFLGATQISGVAETIAKGLINPSFATEQIALAAIT